MGGRLSSDKYVASVVLAISVLQRVISPIGLPIWSLARAGPPRRAIADANHNRDLALTEAEDERWQEYQRTMPEHFGTFSLTQSAENDHAVTCCSDIMYTVIKTPKNATHYIARLQMRRAWTAT